jgi:hypothetical protein
MSEINRLVPAGCVRSRVAMLAMRWMQWNRLTEITAMYSKHYPATNVQYGRWTRLLRSPGFRQTPSPSQN